MSDDLAFTIAGIGIMLAIPLTVMFANWLLKKIDHGVARFGPVGKLIAE